MTRGRCADRGGRSCEDDVGLRCPPFGEKRELRVGVGVTDGERQLRREPAGQRGVVCDLGDATCVGSVEMVRRTARHDRPQRIATRDALGDGSAVLVHDSAGARASGGGERRDDHRAPPGGPVALDDLDRPVPAEGRVDLVRGACVAHGDRCRNGGGDAARRVGGVDGGESRDPPPGTCAAAAWCPPPRDRW
jgi:hypothetical protein